MARAFSYWSWFAPTVTGSKRAIALATSTQARCDGLAPRRQLSGRCGHSIQVWACGSNSPGMRKPSARGVLSIVCVMIFLSVSGAGTMRVPALPARALFTSVRLATIASPPPRTKRIAASTLGPMLPALKCPSAA